MLRGAFKRTAAYHKLPPMKPAELSYPEVSTQPEQLLEEHAWNSMENKGSLWLKAAQHRLCDKPGFSY